MRCWLVAQRPRRFSSIGPARRQGAPVRAAFGILALLLEPQMAQFSRGPSPCGIIERRPLIWAVHPDRTPATDRSTSAPL